MHARRCRHPTGRRFNLLAVLLAAFTAIGTPCQAHAAEPLLKVAVLSAVQSPGESGWPDLVSVALGRLGVQTVERDSIAKVNDEQALAGLVSIEGVGQRAKLGHLVGADVLLLLTSPAASNAASRVLHGVVSDTKTGARLGTFDIPLKKGDAESDAGKAAIETKAVVGRFANGVRSIVCVSNFLCRNLTHDDDPLQQDFAVAIRSALANLPGTAVVEIEEARAIRAELDLVGRNQVDPRRPVPATIEGEYRTTRKPGESPTITLVVRIKSGDRLLQELAPAAMPLDSAGAFVSQDVPRALLAQIGGPDAPALMKPETQFANLITRADQFAKIGDWPTSTALREAALLIRPDAVKARGDLIREYARHNRDPVEGAFPPDAKQTPTDPFWSGIVSRSKADWLRSLQHCEYLIRNRKVSREEGTRLADDAVHSITGVRVTSSEQLADLEVVKKRFVRDVFSRVPSLTPATIEELRDMSGAMDAYHFCMAAALFRCDGNYYAADDLGLLSDLLLRQWPESMEPSYQLNFFLRDAGYRLGQRADAYHFTRPQYDAFLDGLIASNRPVAQVHGRYGRLMLRLGEDSSNRAGLFGEASAIVRLAEAAGLDTQDYSYFMRQLRDEAARLAPKIEKTRTASADRSNVATTQRLAGPTTRPRTLIAKPRAPAQLPKQLTAAMTLEPITLRLDADANADRETLPERRWRSPGGWGAITDYRPAGPKLDLLWTAGALLYVSEPGVARVVLADDQLAIMDVVFDGKYVWVISCYDQGIYVLDTAGKTVAHIDKRQGLPPISGYGANLLPIGEGRVMAVGTFGNDYRAWLATVDLDLAKKAGVVDVFHEATTVFDNTRPHVARSADATSTFRPSFLVGHTTAGTKPKRLAFVGRDRYDPLVVDVDAKKVWVYPSKSWKEGFPRNYARAEAFASVDGTLYIAGGGRGIQRYDMPDADGLLIRKNIVADWGMGGVRSGVLARSGDWLYVAGDDWRRVNLHTGQEQMLSAEPRALPDFGSGGDWQIGTSGVYGLVAFHRGKMYRMRLP